MKKQVMLLMIVILAISVANAAQIGASLTVPPENNTSISITFTPSSPKAGQTVKFIADYEDENGTDIQGASVNITIDGTTHSMVYSSSDSAYIFEKNLGEGTYFFKVVAKKTGYKLAEKNSTISVSDKKENDRYTSDGVRPEIIVNLSNQSTTHPPVLANENMTIIIDILRSFYKITIVPNTNILFGTISINSCNKPMKVEGVFYDCMSMNLTRINPSQYKSINLYFKITKSWIKAHNINSSKINVIEISNDNKTKLLNVTKISEDEDYFYFSTSTDGLSDFVIYGNVNNSYCGDGICSENENCSSCSEDCGTCPQIKSSTLLEIAWYWWLVLISIPIIAYYYKSRIEFSKEEIKKAKRRLNYLEAKYRELVKKAKQLEKSSKKSKKKKNPKRLAELKKIHERIEDIKEEIVEIEHKYNIKPERKKKK